MQESWVWSLCRECSLDQEMATHSSILAWRTTWTEEPGGLQSMGSQSRTWLKQLSTRAHILPWTRTDLKLYVSIRISSKFCSLDWTLNNTEVCPQTFMGDAGSLIVVIFGERGWKTIMFYFTPSYTVGCFYMTGEWGAKEMTRTWRILQPIGEIEQSSMGDINWESFYYKVYSTQVWKRIKVKE